MKLYLVRHGETDANKDGIMQGVGLNYDLNRNGINNVKSLKKDIDKLDITACFTSPLLRSWSTAIILVGDRVEIKEDKRLIERYLGDLEGKNKKDYNVKEYWDISLNSNEHGVEPIKNVISRCEEFLDYLKENYNESDNILIVSHNAVVKAIINIIENKKYKTKLEVYNIPNGYFKELELK